MTDPAALTRRLAADPAATRGRLHGVDPAARRGPRDAFGRDRDRIIHSIAFRRLGGKTQVFIAPDDDHYRVRLTHSLEVAQIARTLARALGLNEDLTEAIALAHDLGHPPFGHAGEAGLKRAMMAAGGFDHNGHTLRILTHVESPYPTFRGLDLSWETLEGLAKHNGPVRHPGWAVSDADAAFPLDLGTQPALEAQVAAIADDIAYDNHDIDDGLRAGVLSFDALIAEPLVAAGWDRVCARLPGVPLVLRLRELVRDQIGAMVEDVLAETRRRVSEAGVETAGEVRAAAAPLVGFSHALAGEERSLKRFLYRDLYHCAEQSVVAAEAERVVGNLHAAYQDDPRLLPPAWAETLPEDPVTRGRHVGDFVAGMTDRYAIARHREIAGEVRLPERF